MEDNASNAAFGAEIPAIYVNRFSIIVGPVTTRITFSEALVGTNGLPRSAVAMKTSDAKQLAELLLDLIKHRDSTEKPS